MERQDYAYLVHTIKNANNEIKKIRRKFNKEKLKYLSYNVIIKLEKRDVRILTFFSTS